MNETRLRSWLVNEHQRYNTCVSDADLKRWAETWERAGRELALIRRRELERMTDDDVRRAIADLFSDTVLTELPPRTTSGLVEQQRWFTRLRESS